MFANSQYGEKLNRQPQDLWCCEMWEIMDYDNFWVKEQSSVYLWTGQLVNNEHAPWTLFKAASKPLCLVFTFRPLSYRQHCSSLLAPQNTNVLVYILCGVTLETFQCYVLHWPSWIVPGFLPALILLYLAPCQLHCHYTWRHASIDTLVPGALPVEIILYLAPCQHHN